MRTEGAEVWEEVRWLWRRGCAGEVWGVVWVCAGWGGCGRGEGCVGEEWEGVKVVWEGCRERSGKG